MPFSCINTNFLHRRLAVYQPRTTVNASGDLENTLYAVADLLIDTLQSFYKNFYFQ